jgi:hypothetical protein
MSQERRKLIEETLDPADWEFMRVLGHRMVDDMLTYLQNVRSEPSGFPTQQTIEDICVSTKYSPLFGTSHEALVLGIRCWNRLPIWDVC